MALYRKIDGEFQKVDDAEEARLRADPAAVFAIDSAFEVVLSADEIAELQQSRADAPKAPRSEHIAWVKAALVDLGKAVAVDALVSKMDPIKRTLWEYSTAIREDDPDVTLVAKAVGVDLKRLFDRASELKAARGL